MHTVWKEICAIEADDGITFDGEALRVRPIREEFEYGGLRLQTTATLARAKIYVTVQAMVALGRANSRMKDFYDGGAGRSFGY